MLYADQGEALHWQLPLPDYANSRLMARSQSIWDLHYVVLTSPLRKADGGLRPIAVGEVLRRLACKTLLNTAVANDEVLRWG